MRSNAYRCLLLSGAAAVASIASVARAQDAASPVAAIAEVVVTAQKRAENVQEVPIAITALSADSLRARDVTSVRDLATQVPAMVFGEVAGTTQISARGVGFGLLTGVGENSVATQSDGVYIPRPGAAGMLFDDVGRIEFLRGPQGTLYGRNATAGVLNLVSPTPPSELERRVSIGGGDHDAFRASASVGGPLTDTIRARAFVQRDEHDGYILNTANGQRLDDLQRWTGRLALDADLGENLTVEARAFTVQDHFRGPLYDPIDPAGSPDNPLPASAFDIDPFRVKADANYDSTRSIAGGSLRLNYDLGWARLVSITGYQHYKFFEKQYDGDGTLLNLFLVRRPESSKSFSQEFNLIGATDSLDWSVGAYYLSDKSDVHFHTDTPGFLSIGLQSLDQILDEDSQYGSAFADATWRASDAVALFGGLRVIREERKASLVNTLNFVGGVVLPVCLPGTPGGDLEISDTDVTGRLGVRYAPTSAANLYAQYSRGAKSGGFGASSCGNIYKPERLDALEAGWKQTLLEGRLRINAAAYYYDYTDLQVEQIINTSLFIRNAPKSRIHGVEAEITWVPDSQWEFNLNVSAMKARYREFSDVDPLRPQLGVLDLSGRSLNRAPDWTFSLGGQRTFDLPDGSRLRPRAEVYASAKYALRPYGSEADSQPSFTTLAASVTWISKDDRWTLRAYGRNLSNEAYLQGIVANPGQGRLGNFAPPRTFGMELSAQF